MVDDSVIVFLFVLNSIFIGEYVFVKNFLVCIVFVDKNNEVKKRIKVYLSNIVKKEENYLVYDMFEFMLMFN